MLVLDLPILREVELVLVWTVHTLFEYAQCSLRENQFVSSIHKYCFRQDPLCIHVSGSRILLLRAIVLFLFPKMILIWQLSNSWLDLRLLWHPVTGFPVLAKNWLCTLKQAFSFASDKPATSSHLPLAPEGTMMKPANSWCARRQSQHLGTSRRCRQGCRLSWHSSPGRMNLLPQSLQSFFFLKVPRPLTRDFSAILPCLAYSWYKFHEDPDFVLTFLLEVVIDLAWIAHTLQ